MSRGVVSRLAAGAVLLGTGSWLGGLAGCGSSTQVRVALMARDGQRQVEEFFRTPFPSNYDVKIFETRRDFADWSESRFGFRADQCWMVAIGVGDTMTLIDPAAWETEACEHDPSDEQHVRRLITHELVHVYHGQHAPDPDFTGMDEMAWFVEGLAVYASGQYDDERREQAVGVARSAELPGWLDAVWSGPARYALGGSMAAYVDATYGRATTVELLKAGSNREVLARLESTEPLLIEGWSVWLSDQAAEAPGE